jgi:hypothetical protein
MSAELQGRAKTFLEHRNPKETSYLSDSLADRFIAMYADHGRIHLDAQSSELLERCVLDAFAALEGKSGPAVTFLQEKAEILQAIQAAQPPSFVELVGQPPLCLDQESVLKDFLGKTVQEVREMLKTKDLTESFAYMATGGLLYYLPAAMEYLESVDSTGDFGFASGLLCSLFRQIDISGLKGPALPLIKRIADYCDQNCGKFEVDRDQIAYYLRKIRASEPDDELERDIPTTQRKAHLQESIKANLPFMSPTQSDPDGPLCLPESADTFSCVVFQCHIATDPEILPPGRELAEFLAERLRQEGLDVYVVNKYLETEWLLAWRGFWPAPWLHVGRGANSDFWHITIVCGESAVSQFFGRSDQELRSLVIEKIRAILAGDSRFSDVYWSESESSEG